MKKKKKRIEKRLYSTDRCDIKKKTGRSVYTRKQRTTTTIVQWGNMVRRENKEGWDEEEHSRQMTTVRSPWYIAEGGPRVRRRGE